MMIPHLIFVCGEGINLNNKGFRKGYCWLYVPQLEFDRLLLVDEKLSYELIGRVGGAKDN